MKIKTTRAYLIFLIIIFSPNSNSQQIVDVDFTVTKNDKIIVSYDLINCPDDELYDIKLKVNGSINNSFDAFTLTGDINKIKEGANKKIEWNVKKDLPELIGRFQVIVEIVRTYSTKITMGPSHAFKSMLLPGLGDFYIGESNRGILTTTLFIGSVYLAFGSYASLKESKNNYYSSISEDEIDKYYKMAKSDLFYTQLLLGVATAIWLEDVIYVTIKGIKNRESQLNGYTKNSINLNLYLAGTPDNFRIGVVKYF